MMNMKPDSYAEAVSHVITEMEAHIQQAIRNNIESSRIEKMKRILDYLRNKQTILNSKNNH